VQKTHASQGKQKSVTLLLALPKPLAKEGATEAALSGGFWLEWAKTLDKDA